MSVIEGLIEIRQSQTLTLLMIGFVWKRCPALGGREIRFISIIHGQRRESTRRIDVLALLPDDSRLIVLQVSLDRIG
jgi:hypothetical protein